MKLLRQITNDQLIIPLYLPSLIFSISQGILIPILPLYASEAGFSYALIGLILAGESIGMLLGDLPSGVLIQKYGKKNVMILGLGLTAISTLSLFWAKAFLVIMLLRIIAGVGAAMFNVSRFVYLAEFVTIIKRGRASALFGGIKRIGTFIGPIIGGVVAAAYGLRAPFILYAVCLSPVLFIVLNSVRSSDKTIIDHGFPLRLNINHLISTLKSQSKTLMTAGTGNFFMMMVRSVPAVIIPLYSADVLGLDVQEIGFIVSMSAAVDMLFFYPSGVIMDRFGRKYAIIISLFVLSIGIAAIPFTNTFQGMLLAAMVAGFGNGIGSGTMLTLGADLASPKTRGEFLGAWLFIGNFGSMSGPLIVGVIASIFFFGQAALVIAGTGLLGIFTFALFVPETLKKKTHTFEKK